MDRLFNALKAQAGTLDSRRGEPRFGIVVSVDPPKSMARVMLQPEAVLTSWLPVLSPWTGNSWGLVCPPSPGDQVFVIPQEGDAEHGVIVGRVYSTSQLAPTAAAGELWLMHASGSCIKLMNDGTVRIVGDLHVDGEVYDRRGAMSEIRSVHDRHTHVDSRGGVTSTPRT
jgi:phage baseplate assembly protein gpV